jgi:4-hydroxy-2-oxoheptanedioate aldolase
LLIVLQCEHIESVRNADAIFSVPGIDAIFVGPNDLAASMRSADGRPPTPEATREAMNHILQTCKKYKVAAGVHTSSPAEALVRIEEGWQFIAITSELKMMLDGAATVLRGLGGNRLKGDLAKY